jgi:hypothetical protein
MLNEDFLIKTAATLLGLPPAQMREHFAKLQQWNVEAITGFDSRIRRLESELQEQTRLLSLIAAKLGVNENGSNGTNEQSSASIHAIADQRIDSVANG